MRAVLRLVVMAFVAGLSLAPVALHAQEAAQNNAAPADAIGPRELQNFNLQGTVTRQAEPTATPPAREASRPSVETAPERAAPAGTQEPRAEAAVRSLPAERNDRQEAATRASTAVASARASEPTRPASRSSITVALPPARTASAPVEFPEVDPAAAAALTPDQGPGLWPWLLAAIALGAGGAFLFWRRNHREAFAGGPQIDAFVAPTPLPPRQRAEPVPTPPVARTPAGPAPPVAAPPAPGGIVATRLRPWLDVEFEPDRVVVEDERVIFEFELDVLNSGSVPATDVRVGIQLFNAAPDQDEALALFFAEDREDANRAPDIAPYKKFELKPQLVVPRDRLRILEAGGRRFFVPLIGINILYRSGRAEGQSAAGFLLGRDSGGEKLAPFRVDLGPRVYRGIGARILPGNIRR